MEYLHNDNNINLNQNLQEKKTCFVTQLVKSCYDTIKSQNDVNFAFQSLFIMIGKYRNTF